MEILRRERRYPFRASCPRRVRSTTHALTRFAPFTGLRLAGHSHVVRSRSAGHSVRRFVSRAGASRRPALRREVSHRQLVGVEPEDRRVTGVDSDVQRAVETDPRSGTGRAPAYRYAAIRRALEVAGASPWQRFRHITLPLILHALLVAMLFRTIDAMRVYGIIEASGAGCGTVPSLSCLVVDTMFGSTQAYASAATVAFITASIIGVAITVYLLALKFTTGGTHQ